MQLSYNQINYTQKILTLDQRKHMKYIPVVNPLVSVTSLEDAVVSEGHLFFKVGSRRIIDAFHTST